MGLEGQEGEVTLIAHMKGPHLRQAAHTTGRKLEDGQLVRSRGHSPMYYIHTTSRANGVGRAGRQGDINFTDKGTALATSSSAHEKTRMMW